MIQTIKVKNLGTDLLGNSVLTDIKNILNINSIEKIKTAKVFRVEGINKEQAQLLADKLFSEKLNQTYSLSTNATENTSDGVRLKRSASHDPFEVNVIEIAYKPGVMNPEAASILKAAKDLGITVVAADSSREYEFFGKLSEKEIEEIIKKLNLLNPTVEQIVKIKPQTLLIKGSPGKTLTIPIRKMQNQDLINISKDKLFLNLEEMKIIQKYFQSIKRDPTDCELETIAQTWSEHCAHKTFKAKIKIGNKFKEPLISRIKKEALKHKKNIVSAFVDNSGVMDFYEGYGICGKVETHNAPSAIEPYGGAMTGSGGVFRDVLGTGQGAKPIASTDIFCFADPNLDNSKLPKGCLPPKYLLKRVVAGVKDYGNRIGIPTNNGSVHFHDDFRAKPTIIAGSYGILPKKQAQKGTPKTGDVIIVIGGKTGRDGIHGATFSSGEMTNETINVNSSAVQIGNAIEEKRTFDAMLEARDQNLIRAIQDLGAGGFSSAVGEMGENLGVTVDLAKAPLKYQGLAPWEIWISESQERMALAIPKTKIKKFIGICNKYNVESSILGRFDEDKKLKVYFGKEMVCNLDMDFLHHGLPQRTMVAVKPNSHPGGKSAKRTTDRISIDSIASPASGEASLQNDITIPQSQNGWISTLEKVLSNGNVCSKEPIVRLYDHSVQGTNDLQPYSGENLDGPNDSSVLRPFLDKKYGVVISHGLNPVLNKIDPYWGSIWAATEALANFVAVGGDYKNASLINNYIWPFPDEESLWSLDQSVDAVVDFMKALNLPVISGKDSLSSTYRGADGTIIKIPPVLCISVFGKIADTSKTVSSDLKKEGSTLVLVGKMDFENMGGSIYFSSCHPELVSESPVPKVDLKILPKILDSIYQGIQKNEILSCHDISEGGLITAVFEMSVGGNIGVNIHLGGVTSSHLRGDRMNLDVISLNTSDGGRLNPPADGRSHDSSEVKRPDFFLFNETPGAFIVEVENEEVAEKLFKGVPYKIIGKTKKEVSIKVKDFFEVPTEQLKKVWQEPMRKIFS
ncbi:phosphoribosylformylglycinamidine synthase [Candidatus Microgenomates bacterium]|nr:MAG: phosphoribosylformylglycinamidine synthase [Candidatus Microgenomates bacterium]